MWTDVGLLICVYVQGPTNLIPLHQRRRRYPYLVSSTPESSTSPSGTNENQFSQPLKPAQTTPPYHKPQKEEQNVVLPHNPPPLRHRPAQTHARRARRAWFTPPRAIGVPPGAPAVCGHDHEGQGAGACGGS